MMSSIKKYIAEFIGTMVLTLIACGVAAVSGCGSWQAVIATAIAFGLVIVAMAYSIGNISGCHINPAVSIAMFISKKLSLKDFIGYLIAQFTGALAGSALLWYFLGSKDYGLGQNGIYDDDIVKSLIIEVVLTFVFVITIMGVTSKESNGAIAGLVIGGALTLVHLLGIPFTGTSVNPARSFAPALLVGGEALECVWIFILAPIVGGALAAIAYNFLAKSDDK